MNRIFAKLVILAFLVVPGFSSDYSVNFNINYNAGTSDFFTKSENQFFSGGYNYLENEWNKMGIGFSLGVNIPITKKLAIVPGFSVDFGHQKYEFFRVEEASDTDTKDNYFFHIYSGELKLNYNILSFKNGWKIIVTLGAGYNSLKGDENFMIEDKSFWGVTGGIGTQFFQLKHFGFQVFFLYKYPFKEKEFEYFTLQTGIIYRF